MQHPNRRSQMFIIFIIVFIDLAGFGMILPLSSYLAKNYGATPLQVGLLMTIYSLMQFIFSPLWGRLSDRFGRRPILLMSILLSGCAYIGFSFSTTLWMLFFWRAMSGIFTANISTAMAYIADITEEKDRSKSMGLIGAAFGLGFMTGPAIGGILGEVGTHISHMPPFGINFAAFVAGCLALCNFVFSYKVLRESLTPEQMVHPRERKSRILLLIKNLSRPTVGVVLFLTFLSVFAMAHMESTIFLYVIDKFGWSMRFTSIGFGYIGLVMVITQGYLIRKLLPRFGERKLLVVGFFLVAIGIGGITLVTGAWTMALTQTFLALGLGMINPSLSGSISLLVAKHEQGELLGVNQSMSALGRIIGPALGGFLYGHLSIYSPYLFAGGLMLLGMLVAIKIYSQLPEKGKAS